MSDQKEIYEKQADRYEMLVSREDYRRNLIAKLDEIAPIADRDVVELGAGTGRLTRLLSPLAGRISALDSSPHMLEVAATKLVQDGLSNWSVVVADHRDLPLRDRSADLVIAGWSFCYLSVWAEGDGRSEVARALRETARVLRRGGTTLIVETLGPGRETPQRSEELAPYLAYLDDNGFQSTWIRTDFRFESVAEAVHLVGFFFGEELARQVATQQSPVLPECTGIWWRTS